MTTIKLPSNMLLVKFHFRVWTPKVKDEKLARAGEEKLGLKYGRASATVRLMDDHRELAAVLNYKQLFYQWCRANTGRWEEWGARYITAAKLLDFMPEWEARRDKFFELVDIADATYPQYYAAEAAELGASFNPLNYPALGNFKSYFDVGYHPVPLPDYSRLKDVEGFTQQDVDYFLEQAEAELQQKVADAQQDLITRVYDHVNRIAKKLIIPIGESGAKFHDTMLESIQTNMELFRDLNITKDPKLTELLDEIETKILVTHPDNLRNNPITRQAVANNAISIADKLQKMFE